MAKARDVAGFLIELTAQEPEPELVTPLRLQKLLYYVQGWSLAIRQRPMFSEPIEAWKHGPVVPSEYQRFADHKNEPILHVEEADDLSEEDGAFVRSIWEGYKGYSATALWDMTHSEQPWREARQGCAPDERCSTEISPKTMAIFFRGEFERHHIPGLELDAIHEAEHDLRQGRGIPLDDLATR